jgi:hypothetical protein
MTTIDLDAKARDIRRKLGALHRLSRRTADMAVDIGNDLLAAKRAVKRSGEDWLPWLAKHRISHDISARLISLAKWSKSNSTEFRKLRNCLPVTTLYRISRYGIDEVEKLLRQLERGELKPGTKPATTLHQMISRLSRRSRKPKAEESKPEPEPESPASSAAEEPTPSAAAKSDPNIARHEAEEHKPEEPERPAAEKPAEEPGDRRGDPEHPYHPPTVRSSEEKMAAIKARGKVDTAILEKRIEGHDDPVTRIRIFRSWLEGIAPEDFAAEVSLEQRREVTNDYLAMAQWFGKAMAIWRDAALAAGRAVKRKLGESEAKP